MAYLHCALETRTADRLSELIVNVLHCAIVSRLSRHCVIVGEVGLWRRLDLLNTIIQLQYIDRIWRGVIGPLVPTQFGAQNQPLLVVCQPFEPI